MDYSAGGEMGETILEPGEYELSGNLGWGVNRRKKIPFSVTFTVSETSD